MSGTKGKSAHLSLFPKNFDILTKNIKVNGYKNVKVYCKAISSKNGSSKITLRDESDLCSMLNISDEAISEHIEQKVPKLIREFIKIDTASLDEFLDKEGVNQVNFIRMDIEGYEVEAIKGMINTLKNTPPPLKLFFEVHNGVFDESEVTIGPLFR